MKNVLYPRGQVKLEDMGLKGLDAQVHLKTITMSRFGHSRLR